MIGIMVVGHGHFATGISSAAKLIVGEQENFVAVDFPEGDTKTELEANIADALESLREMDHVLVCCDLLSGSPFNTVVPAAIQDERIRVLYGTNLGMLIEILMNRDSDSDWEEMMTGIVAFGREQIGLFEFKAGEVGDEEDEWD